MSIKRGIFRILMVWGTLVLVVALFGKVAVATDSGRATAEFLNIGVGARAAGLGGAYSAISADASAVYWNPSGVAGIDETQFFVSHISWYQDINYEFLGASYPASDRVTLSASASYLSYGSIEGYDEFDNPTGDVNSTYDMAGGISIGYTVTDNLALGVTAKYVMLSLAGQTANAMAADFGASATFNRLSLGLVVSNFGQKVSFDNTDENLPTALRVGASYAFVESFMAALEVEHQFYGDMLIKNGVEYSYDGRYFMRAGICHYADVDGRDLADGLTFGVGALLGPAQFDYAYSPSEGFSSESIHRLSVAFSLNR